MPMSPWNQARDRHGRHLHDRTASVETALSSGDGLTDALRDELIERRRAWLAHDHRDLSRGGVGLWLLRRASPYMARSTPQLCAAIALGYAVLMMPPVGIVLLLVLIVSLSRRAKRRRFGTLTDALRHVRCPECAYDLRGIDAFDACDQDGIPLAGPRACPECGSPWPLVPPATPSVTPQSAPRD